MISFNKQAPKDWIKSLNQFGHFKDQLNLSDHIKQLVYEQKWEELDALLMQATAADGVIYQYMSQFVKFTKMEFIIAVRDAKNEWEEDGIWHDDGSRVMAFTLSLTIDAEKIEGGVLELRQRGSTESIKFPKSCSLSAV